MKQKVKDLTAEAQRMHNELFKKLTPELGALLDTLVGMKDEIGRLRAMNRKSTSLVEAKLPDPEGRNTQRAVRARDTLDYYAVLAGDKDEPTETQLIDLLTDLAHLCDRDEGMRDDKETLFEKWGSACINYREETGGDGTQFDAV